MLLNDNRPTVCCCNSSTPGVPRSLAGSKIWIADRRTGKRACSRGSTIAMAMAAGCAIECTASSGARNPAGSTNGARMKERGMVFGGVGQVDGARRLRAQIERPQRGFGRSRQQHHGRVAQGCLIERPDQRRFAALLGERAGLLGIFGDQFQIHGHVAYCDKVAQLAPQEGIAADQRPRLRSGLWASQFDAPARRAAPPHGGATHSAGRCRPREWRCRCPHRWPPGWATPCGRNSRRHKPVRPPR